MQQILKRTVMNMLTNVSSNRNPVCNNSLQIRVDFPCNRNMVCYVALLLACIQVLFRANKCALVQLLTLRSEPNPRQRRLVAFLCLYNHHHHRTTSPPVQLLTLRLEPAPRHRRLFPTLCLYNHHHHRTTSPPVQLLTLRLEPAPRHRRLFPFLCLYNHHHHMTTSPPVQLFFL
jgi:hypothetical protein